MDLDDEEKIEQISEPPKIVANKDIIVCMISFDVDFPNLGRQEVTSFVYCLPFKDEDGGKVSAFNPINPEVNQRSVILKTKSFLYQTFNAAIRQALKNPTARVVYKGIVGRDMTYKGMYNSWID